MCFTYPQVQNSMGVRNVFFPCLAVATNSPLPAAVFIGDSMREHFCLRFQWDCVRCFGRDNVLVARKFGEETKEEL